ncbi:SufD family Fe-S cluster assembly protein [bacterium]|nr:SufD family Fe-S cluster assembly protein [bacterium]
MNSNKNTNLIRTLYESVGESHIHPDDVAHIEIHGNKVIGQHLVHGLEVTSKEIEDGVEIYITLRENVKIAKPVIICFGLMHEKGVQNILITTELEKNSSMAVIANCTFPKAIDVLHSMKGEIILGENAQFSYLERHTHSPSGGVTVVPITKAFLNKGSHFRTDFELIKGRVGTIDIDYKAECMENSILEMTTRISGKQNDKIKINEQAYLRGEKARGVLTSNIAVRDNADAEVKNTIIAYAPYARGHVDCKEIVQGNATARAVPIVEVKNPKAHITHEAALGSVDSKQLETLMSRGLSEDEATDLIIEGLLSPEY